MRVLTVLALLAGCDRQEPEDVRGTAIGEPTTPTPITQDTGALYSCSEGPSFPDAWAGAIDPALVTDVPYANDAGIASLLAAAPSSGSAAVSIAITDAVLANYSEYGGEIDQIWIADAGGGVQTYGVDLGLTAAALQPGDTVSFTATEITNYYGLYEITEIEDFAITGTGGAVYVVDGNTTTITVDEHLNENLRAYGTVTSEPEECGTSTVCLDLTFGDNTIALRVSSSLGFANGDCLDVLAPLDLYSGAPQLDIANNNWVSAF